MTIAERVKNKVDLHKDIPWLEEEVTKCLEQNGKFTIICDAHINNISKFSIPYKYFSLIIDWATNEGLHARLEYNSYGVKYIAIEL